MTKKNTQDCPHCDANGWRLDNRGSCFRCKPACTQSAHDAYRADLKTFRASTINHKPWRDDEFEIDMLQGDCPRCYSSLTYDLEEERPTCYEPHDVSDAEAARVLREYEEACAAVMGAAA